MKKTLCALCALLIALSLCACTNDIPKPDKDGEISDEGPGGEDVKLPDEDGENDKSQDGDNQEGDDPNNTGENGEGVPNIGLDDDPVIIVDDPVNTDDEDYVKPASFAKAYTAITDLRYAYYNVMKDSLSSVSESSEMYVNIYKAMAGESTFVYVSVCGGAGYAEAVKTVLAMGGYHNVTIEETGSSEYKITVDVPIATYVDEESYVRGEFVLSYDKELDLIRMEYSDEEGKAESFAARRVPFGYIAFYESSSGDHIRYHINDDVTGKMAICKESIDALPDTAEDFIPDNAFAVYELTEDKFHCIYDGVEYTYPKIISSEANG